MCFAALGGHAQAQAPTAEALSQEIVEAIQTEETKVSVTFQGCLVSIETVKTWEDTLDGETYKEVDRSRTKNNLADFITNPTRVDNSYAGYSDPLSGLPVFIVLFRLNEAAQSSVAEHSGALSEAQTEGMKTGLAHIFWSWLFGGPEDFLVDQKALFARMSTGEFGSFFQRNYSETWFEIDAEVESYLVVPAYSLTMEVIAEKQDRASLIENIHAYRNAHCP